MERISVLRIGSHEAGRAICPEELRLSIVFVPNMPLTTKRHAAERVSRSYPTRTSSTGGGGRAEADEDGAVRKLCLPTDARCAAEGERAGARGAGSGEGVRVISELGANRDDAPNKPVRGAVRHDAIRRSVT